MKIKKENFIKNIFILLFSQFLIKIIGLVYKLYLTNKDGFGDSGNAIYSSGFQIYSLLLTFSSIGVPNAISRLVSEKIALGDLREAHRIFKISFFIFSFIGGICSILLFCNAKAIANILLQIPEAEYSIKALSPSIFFVSIISVFRGYFNGMQNFSVMAKSQTIEQLSKTIFTIIFVELVTYICTINTTIMAAAANLATATATVISFIYIVICYKKSKINLKIRTNKNNTKERLRDVAKKIVNVAFPISITSIMSSFIKNIDSFTVVRFLKKFMLEKDAIVQYGILSGKIDTLCVLPLAFNSAIVTTIVPNVAKVRAQGKNEVLVNKINIFLKITTMMALPCSLGIMTFSSQIMNLLFPKASNGAELLKISGISVLFMMMSQTLSAILQGLGEEKVPPVSLGIGLILKILCNIVLIRIEKVGIYGAIIGNIICNFVCFFIEFIFLIKKLKFNKYLNSFAKSTMASFIMVIVMKKVYNIAIVNISSKSSTIISIIMAIIVYIILNFMLRNLSKKELEEI